METAQSRADASTADLNRAVKQYRQIADAAMSDAETWLQHESLSGAIFEAMPDAIVVVDAAGLIVSVNSQFELMFGYHRSEVMGFTPELLLPEGLRSIHVDQRRSYFDNPRVRDMGDAANLLGRRKNGVEMPLLIKLGPIVIPSGVYTIVCIRRMKE
jgi:PAS domain S-box-containing protein